MGRDSNGQKLWLDVPRVKVVLGSEVVESFLQLELLVWDWVKRTDRSGEMRLGLLITLTESWEPN